MINSSTPTVTVDNVQWSNYLDPDVLNTELQRIRKQLGAPMGFRF